MEPRAEARDGSDEHTQDARAAPRGCGAWFRQLSSLLKRRLRVSETQRVRAARVHHGDVPAFSERQLPEEFFWTVFVAHARASTKLAPTARSPGGRAGRRRFQKRRHRRLSAIAHSQMLHKFASTVSNSRDAATWLNFALFSKAATHHIRTVRLAVGSAPVFVEALRAIVEHANPVRYMLALQEGGGNARGQRIAWPASTVRVNAQTAIHVDEPLSATKTVYHGKQDAVCHVADDTPGEFVRVLIPGVGFGRIHRKDVLSQDPAVLREAHSVRSLTLSIDLREVAYFAAVLALIGAPLTSLTLHGSFSRSVYRPLLRLNEIFAACPRLEHLTLVGVKFPIETLLPSRFGRCLKSIKLRDCHVTTDKINVPFCITPQMAPQLTSFHVDYDCSTGKVSLRAFAIELLHRRRLEQFVLRCPRGDQHDETENTELTARFHGQRFPGMVLREKLAFLCIVHTHSNLIGLRRDIVPFILEMASSPVQHRCCALLRQRDPTI